jgi:hypothetical protein
VQEERGHGREHVGKGRTALEVCDPDYGREGEESCLYSLFVSSKLKIKIECGVLEMRGDMGREEKRERAYKSNPKMNPSIMNKPIHERPLRWHHIRILLPLLRCLLLC